MVVGQSIHWLPKDANGEMREAKKDYTVEIPAYPDGEVGELWVLRTKDGNIEVVSSNYQPNHPNWPGKVKGWPVPSSEYRRDRWEIHHRLAEASVENSRDLIRQLKYMREKTAQRAWDHYKEYGDRNELKKFSGPSDPAFRAYLKSDYESSLNDADEHLKKNYGKQAMTTVLVSKIGDEYLLASKFNGFFSQDEERSLNRFRKREEAPANKAGNCCGNLFFGFFF